jgi:hypothetical protein
MLTLRHLLAETEGLFVAQAGELPLLGYYANAIRHYLDAPAAPASQAKHADSGGTTLPVPTTT